MNLMGLDPATNTGFALCGDDGQIHTTGRWSPKAKWTEKSTETKDAVNAQIACEARRWIMTMIKLKELHAVGMEDLNDFISSPDGKAGRNPTPMDRLTAVQMGFRMGCTELSVPFYLFKDATWRKTFLGYGRIVIPKEIKGEARKQASKESKKKIKNASKLKCDELHIPAKSEDAREAAGVLFHLCAFLGHRRHQGPFTLTEQAA